MSPASIALILLSAYTYSLVRVSLCPDDRGRIVGWFRDGLPHRWAYFLYK